MYGETRPSELEINDRAEWYCEGRLISFGDHNPKSSVKDNKICSGSGDILTVTVKYDYEFLVFPNLKAFFSSDDTLKKMTLEQETVMRCE